MNKEIKHYKVKQLPSRPLADSVYWVKASPSSEVSGYITDLQGVPYPLKDISGSGGIQTIINTDGNLVITGADNKTINISPTLLSVINSALQSGDNISELTNDAGYLTTFTETDPIFQASEASLFVAGDKANLDNQSGINSGDETTLSIQTKRPLKTVNNESLEGSGNIQIDYNDLDNLPTIPTVITNHSGLTLDDGTNPHGTTKSDVGLSNVDNTSDIDKPISTATQTELDDKLDKVSTSGVERAYIINADGSQGTKATSEFGADENNLYRSFFQYSARNDGAGIVALNAPVALVTSGTQSFVNLSGVSKYASIPLQNYLSATANGSNCGWKQGNLADGIIRQGFDIYMIWANNDANSNCQTLVGSYNLMAAIPNLAVSSFTGDFFGVSNDVGDTNLSFYAHRVAAGGYTASYTKVATDSRFPAHDTTSAYMLRMEAPCTEVDADRYIKMTLTNIITGATISHTFPYTETPALYRNVLCVINRNNRNTGVATNIRPSKIHYSRLIY